MNQKTSSILFAKALRYFPGGVNSPVRAFRAVGGTPLFIERGKGCRILDADGNEYIDFCCSWGPLILGHDHPAVRENIIKQVRIGTSFGAPTRLENCLAEIILSHNQYIEKMRFVSSGTEAVMSAIRLARGFTGRDKIIKFEGCYHGHADSLLVKAGSGLATFGISSSGGVPGSFASETIVLPLNDKVAVEKAFNRYKNQIASVIIEPIPANNGLLLQHREYLRFLREICSEYRTLLIFDEVITGFRVGFDGAAGFYKIKPDIITYGKIIGGGLPVGAYASSEKIMSEIAPDGNIYQAGTLSGNPVAMAAGIAALKECLKQGFYEKLNSKTEFFVNVLSEFAKKKKYPVKIFSIGSIFWIAFTEKESIQSATDVDSRSMKQFNSLYRLLLQRGIYFGPSGYEVGFVSQAHSRADIKKATDIICACLARLFRK